MLLFEMRYEVPSGPSASRSAFHPALAAAEPGLGYGLSAGGNLPGTLFRSPTTTTTHPLDIDSAEKPFILICDRCEQILLIRK
jgi:hypothetical protein